MSRLTTTSKITGLPMLAELQESCGEDSCSDECDRHGNGSDCEGCGVQKAISLLAHFEDLQEQGRLVELPERTNTKQIQYIFAVAERAHAIDRRMGKEVKPLISWQCYNLLMDIFSVDEFVDKALKESEGHDG